MQIKWESNSRVKNLAGQGKIDPEDIIKRTQTNNFPAESATVRMAKVREQEPLVTIHIRGVGTKRTNSFNNYSWISSPVMRVNFGGGWNECLSEVEILATALNMSLEKIEDYIYEDNK